MRWIVCVALVPRVMTSATNNVSISGHYDIVLLNN